MEYNIMHLLKSDLQSILTSETSKLSKISANEHFYSLIDAWLTQYNNLAEISAQDYIIFKTDLQKMICAETELIENTQSKEIWLVVKNNKK